jgi:hypothetical protein
MDRYIGDIGSKVEHVLRRLRKLEEWAEMVESNDVPPVYADQVFIDDCAPCASERM